jgi:hypothetical protein
MGAPRAARGVATIIVSALVAAAAASDVAMSLNPADMTGWGWPLADTNHGWEFTVNSTIQVTHLGLLDVADPPDDITPDGFLLSHAIGLFRVDGTLLTASTMDPGTGAMLLDNYRYVPVSPVTLSPGVHYVVGFYTATADYPNVDYHIANIPEFAPNPAINYVISRWGTGSGLGLPNNLIDPGGSAPYRFGPNFLFVPEPTTFAALALWGLLLLSGRGRTAS